MTKKPKVLIATISNRDYSVIFHNCLMNLYYETGKSGYGVDIVNFRNCSVDAMRNYACRYAVGKNQFEIKYDYIVMLDDDHSYPADFIVKFIEHNKDVVVGCTWTRMPPYHQTQYRVLKEKNINTPDNYCEFEGHEGLQEIGATGAAGILIKVSALEKLKEPFFERKFEIDENGKMDVYSSDIQFCKKLKKNGIKIYCDAKYDFPHEVKGMFSTRGDVIYIPS